MELNIATALDAIAEAMPERECIIWRDRHVTTREFAARTNRLAHAFLQAGIGLRSDAARDAAPWDSPHHHVALMLSNGNEYLECMIGSWKARAASFNVNYRYVREELHFLLEDARTSAVIYHARYAPTLADVLPTLSDPPTLLIHVDDESTNSPIPGAVRYDDALAAASSSAPDTQPSPDDLYVLYTGGTTGMPKGTLWRQADLAVAALNLRRNKGSEFETLGEIVDRAAHDGERVRVLPCAPFMHGAAQWNALSAMLAGGVVVIPARPEHLEPDDILDTMERHRVSSLQVVGDAMARPLLEEQIRNPRDLKALRLLISGGAVLSAELKHEWCALVPGLRILDILGSSESGSQAVSDGTTGGRFKTSRSSIVLRDDLSEPAMPGDPPGWLAATGRIPLGYFQDPARTVSTFPVINGTRYVVPGDRALLKSDGTIELLGRDSTSINSGGEKIFAEEVEQALKHHHTVADALVVGRKSDRWGQEVVAVIQICPGGTLDEAALIAEAARHIARYKLPKAFVLVDRVLRSPSGKADYTWANSLVER